MNISFVHRRQFYVQKVVLDISTHAMRHNLTYEGISSCHSGIFVELNVKKDEKKICVTKDLRTIHKHTKDTCVASHTDICRRI